MGYHVLPYKVMFDDGSEREGGYAICLDLLDETLEEFPDFEFSETVSDWLRTEFEEEDFSQVVPNMPKHLSALEITWSDEDVAELKVAYDKHIRQTYGEE